MTDVIQSRTTIKIINALTKVGSDPKQIRSRKQMNFSENFENKECLW